MSETPKCFASDGKTQILSAVGMPLMVSANEFNRVYGELCAITEMHNALEAEVMRTWFALKDLERHPGRTDDTLSKCVRRAIEQQKYDSTTFSTSQKRIYLSGPITGIPDRNLPAFNAEAKRFRDLGHFVVNPIEINKPGQPWTACLRADIKRLCDCTHLALLPGWQHSKGAQLELHIAHRLDIIIELAEDIT